MKCQNKIFQIFTWEILLQVGYGYEGTAHGKTAPILTFIVLTEIRWNEWSNGYNKSDSKNNIKVLRMSSICTKMYVMYTSDMWYFCKYCK